MRPRFAVLASVLTTLVAVAQEFSPRFLRLYGSLHGVMRKAFEAYITDVKSGGFPSQDESY